MSDYDPNIRFPEQDDDVHLPSDALSTMDTLCGYVQPGGGKENTDEPATCIGCLSLLRHVADLIRSGEGLPKGWRKKSARTKL